MFTNVLKVAFRNISRHKGFSFLNITGLTLGLTACLLIVLFVRDEKQFDKFIPDGERIYRAYYQITNAEGTKFSATTPPTFPAALQQNFPEAEQALRVLNIKSKVLFETGGKKIYEQGGILTDPAFFDMFPHSFIHGSSPGVLADPTSIVLSQELAERYFGTENPIGKEIYVDKGDPYQVKGVFKKESKFHLPIDFLLPLSSVDIPKERMQNWEWYGFHNYLKLKKGTDVQAFETKFQRFTNPILNKGDGSTFVPYFQQLHQIHLHSSSFDYDMAERGNITYVRALTIIALFILLIACFNFINLATAKSLQRAKEVGVRKTIGASRGQLILQFTGEAVLLTAISIILTLIFAYFILPALNQFTEKRIEFDLVTNPHNALLLVSSTLVIGMLAGFYPALVLSGFQPVKVLKGAFTGDTRPGKVPWLRHSLVVIQFTLSVLLIIGALVVIKQVHYMHNKDLGFNKEQVLFFPMRGDKMTKNYESLKTQLLQSPFVASVSVGYGFPGDGWGDGSITVSGKKEAQKTNLLMVDEDYLKTLGLKLVSGRDFSKGLKTDVQAFIINETAVKELGFGTPEQALGQTLQWPTWRKADSIKKGQIIGVVNDFHYKSLHDKIEPAVLQIYPEAYSKVAVKIKTTQIEHVLNHVKSVWSRFSPDYPLEYSFLDESFEKMYQAEDKLKVLLSLFTAVTIFVACLGLFGLAAYAAERRRKEIGIRKILGASVQGVVTMLSIDFVKLVLIALLIASPVAGYLMNQWLQNFSYRITLNGWVFVAAGLLTIVIALTTVLFQATKAALSNPVKSLRSE